MVVCSRVHIIESTYAAYSDQLETPSKVVLIVPCRFDSKCEQDFVVELRDSRSDLKGAVR